MKFGETSDSIYAYSFNVVEGYSTPGWAYDKAVKILEAIDGSIIDVINFGAREHRGAEFSVNWATTAEAAALKTYLDANLGLKIRVTIENAGERVFGEQYTAGFYYGYLLEAKHLGEQAFTPTHTVNGYALKLDLVGTAAGSVPNAADASQYDFCIKMDCARITAGCQVANLAALNAITTKPGGSRGLALDTLKVYFFNAATAAWEYQYTLPANDTSKGLKYGVFRWSAFADISSSATGIGGEAYKAGWIVERSIRFPRYSVDARQGPAVEHPEGFSYAADNSGRLWKFPLDNNLAFYGAYCELAVYDRVSGVLVPMRAGYNNQNAFDYQVLSFNVEPGLFMQNRSFPPTTIGKDNYPDAAESVRGNPVQATYGRFEAGARPPNKITQVPAKFPNGRRYMSLVSYVAGVPSVTLDMDAAQFSGALGYLFGSYPASETRSLYVQIVAMDEQPEINRLIKVTGLSSPAAGQTTLILDKAWKVPPDATAQFQVQIANVLLILDDEACIGFRKPGYIKDTAEAGQTIPIEVWAKQDKGNDLKPLPSKIFKPVGSGENQLTVDTDALSLDSFGAVITDQEVPLQLEYPSWMHNVLDRVATGYTTFNFGFSPDGVVSNEVEVRPFDKITQWADEILRFGLKRPGSGIVLAQYSNERTTLIWTPMQGSNGYTITRHIVTQLLGRSSAAVVDSFKLDTTFGTAGVATVSGAQTVVYVDTTVDNTLELKYEYRVQPTFASGAFVAPLASNRGKNRPIPNGAPAMVALGKDGALTVAWALPTAQGSFSVEVDSGSGFAAVAGMPVVSATQNYYTVAGLTNNAKYKVRVKVACISVGVSGDTWYAPDAQFDQPIHYLKTGANDGLTPAFDVQLDTINSNMLNPLMFPTQAAGGTVNPGPVTESRFQLGYVCRNFNTDAQRGAGFPAAAVVFSWAVYLNHDAIGDLSDAKDVRLLSDFVVRLYLSVRTLTKATIQLRGLRADKSTSFTIQYENMIGKAPAETDSFGAFLQFYNLPEKFSGGVDDANYGTENQAPNADGLYTGKDMWKIPDRLFEDGAAEWKLTQYLVFSVTNAEILPWDFVEPKSRGLKIGIGGPPGKTWNMVKGHKSDYFLEVLREFKGGLEEPQYIRIDGGKADATGAITGTAGAPIEKMRHIADDVVQSMLGYKPTYIGNEMQSRLNWVGRWQTRTARDTKETLEILARNLWGFFTLTPDDKLYFRSLDIEDPNVPSVYTFTDSNIIKDSLGKPENRKRNEIFQKFRLKYNVDPSKEGKATEEMLIGWDLANSRPIYSGYPRVAEDSNGLLKDLDGLDNLPDLCRLSIQINAAGAGANEYGVAPGDEKIFEMHYRPTAPSSITREPVERDLPGLAALWGSNVKPPKVSMQELCKMVVQFFTFDSWYFPLSCSMKNLIYNPAISGQKDEAGTADHRLKLGDVVTVNSYFYTNGQPVRAFILDMDPNPLYDGFATLHAFAPRPPGQFGSLVDPIWDAGAPGPRDPANYLFKGSLYGLLSEDGTFADAGAPGARNTNNYKFPDGTFADPKGTGTGKA